MQVAMGSGGCPSCRRLALLLAAAAAAAASLGKAMGNTCPCGSAVTALPLSSSLGRLLAATTWKGQGVSLSCPALARTRATW